MPRISIGPFSLNVREDWTLSTVIFAGPPEEKTSDDAEQAGGDSRPFQRNLIATMERVEPEETPKSYVERQLGGLWKAGVEQYLDEEKQVPLGGNLQGLTNEWMIVGSGGERVRQMQLICIKEGVAYTLIASDLDGEPFEAARQEFKEMLLSFR
jgi:hypothetical protein